MSRALPPLASLLLALAATSLSDLAHAADGASERRDAPAPVAATPTERGSGWLLGAAVHTPISLAILSEDDVNQATLLMTGVDADLSLGRRIGNSSRLALELSAGVRGTLGVVNRFPVQPFAEPAPETIEGFLTYLLPLGTCIDWMPDAPSGWFGSAHVGVGTFNEPPFMSSGNINLAGRFAFDFGWVMPLETGSLALSARYSLLGLKRVYIDEDYNNALVLHELSFGVAWNL